MFPRINYERIVEQSLINIKFKINLDILELEDSIKEILSYDESFFHYQKKEEIYRANHIVKFAETNKKGALAIRYHMEKSGFFYYVNEDLKILMWLGDDLEYYLK